MVIFILGGTIYWGTSCAVSRDPSLPELGEKREFVKNPGCPCLILDSFQRSRFHLLFAEGKFPSSPANEVSVGDPPRLWEMPIRPKRPGHDGVNEFDENFACDFESWEDPIVAPALAMSPISSFTPCLLAPSKEGSGETTQLVPR